MEKDKKISELGKLETVTGEEVALVEKGKKNYGLPLSLLAKARDLEEVNRSIEGLQSDISDLRLQNDYGVAAGLSGCGFYDLVKVVWELFKPKDEVIHLD